MPRRKIRVLLAGWVNRQQQDVIDNLRRRRTVCSEPGFGASVSGSLTSDRRRLAVKAQALGREGAGPDCVHCHTRYASALVPPPHRSQVRWQQEPESRPTSERRRRVTRGSVTERFKAIKNGQGNDDERDMLSSIAGL